jgi:DNA-binding MarR family transcriptional regulator
MADQLCPADPQELGFLIADAARLMRVAFEKRVAQAGLGVTPGEARALINIASTDGSRQLDIAARMGVEPMTLCAYIDKLESLGLVARQPCPADRRAKRINLTPASADVLAAIRQELGDLIEGATQGMDDESRKLLKQGLKSFNANLQASGATQALREAAGAPRTAMQVRSMARSVPAKT